ncbi:MAG: division/cell wall cluster transcriptional repressor MraZ [Planctomycetota bacterium]
MLFLGEYEHSLDQKQRLAIPSELREVLDEKRHGEGFIAAPGANGSLWLWPERTFAQLSQSLGGSLVGDPSMQDFERLVFSQAARVPLDSAGRVRIPDRLLQKFGLSGSIMILGVRDHLELCEPAAWKREQERLQPDTSDIWRRARQALSAALRQET